MNEQIKDGDIVWLKTGSPAMTVKRKREATGLWICSWFVGSEIKESEFSEAQLIKTDPDANKPLSVFVG